MVLAGGALVLALAAVVVIVSTDGRQSSALPLRATGEVALPVDGSRFDYESLDADHGLLFVAHLGAGEVIEIDVRARRMVRTIGDLPQVHGVLVVPALHRVYATATGANQLVALDESTGAVIYRAPTGEYPDGLAYDQRRDAIWTTNKAGGSETVVDAATGAVRGTVALGGEVGNVAYDPTGDQMLVAVQGRDELAVIDPDSLAVVQRVPLSGCDDGHGLTVDAANRLAFVACESNAALLTVDLTTWQVVDTDPVGDDPDVLAYDHNAHRLYVAAESGTVTLLDLRDRRLRVIGSARLAEGAHVVAVDPATHHTYYPVPAGAHGGPALLEREPTD
jgi:DNA-binding beta-propeller fold protein YncE